MSRRSVRRRKSTAEGPGPTRIGVAALLFLVIAIGSTMLSVSLFDDAKDARIAAATSGNPQVDSIYSDRIESQYETDYDHSRYEEIAHSFETDPVYVDDYLAFEVRDEDLSAIHDELEGSEPPIYVAFLAGTELDDTDSQADLLANRIIAEVPDEKATVLVIAGISDAVANKGMSRELDTRPDTVSDEYLSQTGLAFVRALIAAPVEEEEYGYGASFDRGGNPIVVHEDDREDPTAVEYSLGSAVGGAGLGLILGSGLAVGGVLGVRSLRRRRDEASRSAAQTKNETK